VSTRTVARTISLAVIVLFAVTVATRRLNAATPSEVRSLRGLSGVEVVVETPAEELLAAGLSAEQLRGELQSRLQERGIRVLTSGDRAPGRPWLYFRTAAVKSSSTSILGYFVTVQLRQDVSLDRNPDSHCGASTWDASAGGFSTSDAAAVTVRHAAQDLADGFATDFAAANAKH